MEHHFMQCYVSIKNNKVDVKRASEVLNEKSKSQYNPLV